jgi:hypothetical protein
MEVSVEYEFLKKRIGRSDKLLRGEMALPNHRCQKWPRRANL